MQLAPISAVFVLIAGAWIVEWLTTEPSPMITQLIAAGIIVSIFLAFVVSLVTTVRYWHYRRNLRRKRAGSNG